MPTTASSSPANEHKDASTDYVERAPSSAPPLAPPPTGDDGPSLSASASASSSSPSPSSDLFTQMYNHPSSSNPLLPSLPTSTASILANKYDPTLPYFKHGTSISDSDSSPHSDHSGQSSTNSSSSSSRAAVPPPMPEKCFSFCTQSDKNRPLCRMLCLRKKAPAMSREDQLRRLRPPSLQHSSSSTSTSDSSSSSSSSSSSAGSSILSYLSAPFALLKRKTDPYSIVYIKGSPDGVVGRYMEELEWDDGEYDFGSISRGVVAGLAKGKKKEEQKYEWHDWGDHGSILHLPLKTIFKPITSIPSTLSSLLTPSYNLLRVYTTSFTDGSQLRSLDKFTQEIERGGASEMLSKLRGYWEKRIQETREKGEEMLRERQERVKEVGKEVEGKGD